jgi:hypothetical protein
MMDMLVKLTDVAELLKGAQATGEDIRKLDASEPALKPTIQEPPNDAAGQDETKVTTTGELGEGKPAVVDANAAPETTLDNTDPGQTVKDMAKGLGGELDDMTQDKEKGRQEPPETASVIVTDRSKIARDLSEHLVALVDSVVQPKEATEKPVAKSRKAATVKAAVIKAAIGLVKRAKKDMPPFLQQDRPEKVKDIYRALKEEHPGMPAEMKARIAARQGKPGKQKQGPPYKGPLARKKKKKAASWCEELGRKAALAGHDAKQVAKAVKGPDVTVDEAMKATQGKPEKQKAILKELRKTKGKAQAAGKPEQGDDGHRGAKAAAAYPKHKTKDSYDRVMGYGARKKAMLAALAIRLVKDSRKK